MQALWLKNPSAYWGAPQLTLGMTAVGLHECHRVPGQTPFSPSPHPQNKRCQMDKAIRRGWRNSQSWVEGCGTQRGELEPCLIESRLWATVDCCYAIVNKAGCWDQNTIPQESLIALTVGKGAAKEQEVRTAYRHADDPRRNLSTSRKTEPARQRATTRCDH